MYFSGIRIFGFYRQLAAHWADFRELRFLERVGPFIESLSPRNPIRCWWDRSTADIAAKRAAWRADTDVIYSRLAKSSARLLEHDPSNRRGMNTRH